MKSATQLLAQPWKKEFLEPCSESDIYYCFRLLLGRNPSSQEWEGHKSLVGNSLKDVVSTYLSSLEFKNRSLTVLSLSENQAWEKEFPEPCSESDIYYCFRLLLGRNPSSQEWEGHKSLVGNNLKDVVSTYLSSLEFNNRSLTVLSISENQAWEKEFPEPCSESDIYYCFRLLLGRNPSSQEWEGHKSLVGNNLKDVVSTYLSSLEFKKRGLTVLSDTEHLLVQIDDSYKMYVSTSDIAVGMHIAGQKIYEPHVTEAIKNKLISGMFFVDIGANIGYFTLLASHLVGENGKVFAFEPFQYNLKLLYMNVKINQFDNISIYPFAVSDKEALIAYDNMATNGVISNLDAHLDSVLSTTLVYSVKLDDVLRNIPRVDVIKIDVEGAEYLALSGGRTILNKYRPTIFSEFSPPALEATSNMTAEDYLHLLLIDNNYSISVLNKSGDVIDCKNDINKVIQCFKDTASDHIDIVAYPISP
ncbi:MAG: FkbM family methyltransferase [Scytonema sp. RU_4_4]|nr:FkbM family methyltransferase [Scytonema sp. RU_4_4]